MKSPYKPYSKERYDKVMRLQQLLHKARSAEPYLADYRTAIADLMLLYATTDDTPEGVKLWTDRAAQIRCSTSRDFLDGYLDRLEIGIDAQDRMVRREFERMVTGEAEWNAPLEALYAHIK